MRASPAPIRVRILVAHDAVRVHHRRRGLLPRQGNCFGGAWRAAANARLFRAAAQARPVPERRSGHDEPVPARRGLRHRRWRRDRPRPWALRALHRRPGQPLRQRHHRAHLCRGDRQGAPRRLPGRHRAGDPAHHRRDQGSHRPRHRATSTSCWWRSAARSATSKACRSWRRSASSATSLGRSGRCSCT